jgi:uncharacterized protein
MEWYFLYPLIVIAGFGTGYINTLAGSGAAISLIALNFVGLPLNIANGTTRLAILMNTATAAYSFKSHGVYEPQKAVKLILPMVLGAFIGTLIAVFMSAGNLRVAIGVVMVIILITLFLKPKAWLEGSADDKIDLKMTPFKFIAYFLIGGYGGFIQVGTGVFLLTMLVLYSKIDILRANSIKAILMFMYTIISVIIFAFSGLIRWDMGITMAVGSIAGAWYAAKHASNKGAGFIRIILIIVVVGAALHYLGIFKVMFGIY